MTCLTCANWQPKQCPPMAKQGYARCSLGPSYTYLALNHSCPRLVAVAADVAELRREWAKRTVKHETRRKS